MAKPSAFGHQVADDEWRHAASATRLPHVTERLRRRSLQVGVIGDMHLYRRLQINFNKTSRCAVGLCFAILGCNGRIGYAEAAIDIGPIDVNDTHACHILWWGGRVRYTGSGETHVKSGGNNPKVYNVVY